MGVFETIKSIFTNMDFISAITSTVFIILLGYFSRRSGIFNDRTSKILSGIVLKLSLP